MKYLLTLSFALLFFGCAQNLDPKGPYAGDKILWQADQTIETAYTTLDLFVRWEKDNAALLTNQPGVHQAAERVRKGAPEWFRSAILLRDEYAKKPTPENRSSLSAALDVIQVALREVATYLPERPVTTK